MLEPHFYPKGVCATAKAGWKSSANLPPMTLQVPHQVQVLIIVTSLFIAVCQVL